jgi:cobalt-zinc-cadmium efflux system outer membrane protein
VPSIHARLRTGILPALLTACVAVPAAAQTPGRATLTLEDALRMTQAHHPQIRAASLEAEAAHHARRDAGRRANPALGVDFENFGGGLGADGRELTVMLAQPFELGGDRRAREGLALARTETADVAARQAVRTGRLQTVDRFIDAWVLQERAARLRRSEALAREAVVAAAERHRSGAASSIASFQRIIRGSD